MGMVLIVNAKGVDCSYMSMFIWLW
jgi:hypothetical protein